MTKSNQTLAILGGPKAIETPLPHFQWPPKSEKKKNAVMAYMTDELYNDHGYPAIVSKFEKEFAEYHGRKYALALNSGTSTLHAAFYAAGLKEGDELLAPTMTFYATATPVLPLGATPVFCDCEPDTGNIDPADIRRRITDKTKAIVITHLCGHPCEMDEIVDIAKQNNLILIEDCSHAHGSTYKGARVGTFGDIACFSLDNRKILASGEGGVLVTDDRKLFEKCLLIGDFGPRLSHELSIPEIARYRETGMGCKHRIHPHSAAIASEELKSLQDYIKLRGDKLDYLSRGIEGLPGISPPVTRPHVTRGAYFGYRPFYHPEQLGGLAIEDFIAALNAEGMEIRQSGNLALHKLPVFADRWAQVAETTLPNSDAFYSGTLSMPTFTLEPYELLDEYIACFKKVCAYYAETGKP